LPRPGQDFLNETDACRRRLGLDLSHVMSIIRHTCVTLVKNIRKFLSGFSDIYLCGYFGACLFFGKPRDGLVVYVDSDYASDLDKRMSLFGYVFTH
jgi:hypothetical protein